MGIRGGPRLLTMLLLVAGVLLGLVTGCDDDNGGEQALSGMLVMDTAAQHPELLRSAMRFGLALAIAQLHLPPEQAGQLAALGHEHGPAIRAELSDQWAEIVALSDELAAAADQIVVADDPEQAAGLLVMEGELMPLTRFIGEDQAGQAVTDILDSYAELVMPVIETMDVNLGARISGVWNGVRAALRESVDRVVNGAAAGGAQAEDALRDATARVLEALGYEPDEEEWAADLAIPIISEWVALEGETREEALADTVSRIIAEVRPAEEMLIQRTARELVALIALEEAPDLLDKVAAK